ncbi:hypothetical protein K438DRAFT_1771342 [Mycena galopus ATCC 62051]|nr:hypothetical protein K438DRAFT_1771342 [Mycena galopus ATCC 62051]
MFLAAAIARIRLHGPGSNSPPQSATRVRTRFLFAGANGARDEELDPRAWLWDRPKFGTAPAICAVYSAGANGGCQVDLDVKITQQQLGARVDELDPRAWLWDKLRFGTAHGQYSVSKERDHIELVGYFVGAECDMLREEEVKDRLDELTSNGAVPMFKLASISDGQRRQETGIESASNDRSRIGGAHVIEQAFKRIVDEKMASGKVDRGDEGFVRALSSQIMNILPRLPKDIPEQRQVGLTVHEKL